jgi:SAM-dependent methyltransferase
MMDACQKDVGNCAMRSKIISLRQFYSSRLGRRVKQRLRQLTLQHWPHHEGEVIVGVGYAPPLLRVLERAGGRPAAMVALMPAEQGAIYWPVHADNHSVLADELRPPFAVNTLHRVVMLHAFEHHGRPEELLRIFWELLAPGGRILLVVPNRRGRWASLGNTPFGEGIPYSLGQMRAMLEEAQFTLRDVSAALYAPPSAHPFWMGCWSVLERLGNFLCPGLGGVLVIEAEKQIYAAIPEKVAEVRADWADIPVAPAS